MTARSNSKTVATVQRREVSFSGGLPWVEKRIAAKPIAADQFDTLVNETQAIARVLADAEGKVMWNMATLTHNALNVSNFVGKHDGARWATQGDYAGHLGFSKSYMSRMVRLGRAAMVHNIREGSADWTYLCSNASEAAISKALMGDDPKAVKAAIEAHRKGITAPAKREPQPNGGTTQTPDGENRSEAGAPKVTVETPLTYRDLLVILRERVEVPLHKLSDADADKVHGAMLKIVAEDKGRRRLLADKEKAAAAKAGKGAQPTAPVKSTDAPRVVPQSPKVTPVDVAKAARKAQGPTQTARAEAAATA